ncbi:MAG: polysaccharide biosynthesis tyrosine autokinase [Rhodobacteraceae bacterium]|nr:polysaccharide biosynthesis tyrosine autokinase [Paracoccaceae bacterium]
MTNNTSDDEIDLLAIFRIFYTRKITIIFITFIAVLIGVAVALFTIPVYKADSLIQLEEKSSGGLALSADLTGLFSESPQSVTEIEILRSRMILGEVATALKLDISATPKRLPVIGNFLTRYNLPDPGFSLISSYAWSDEAISIALLEVPDSMVGSAIPLTYLGGNSYKIDLGPAETLIGAIGTPLRRPDLGFAVLVDSITGASGRMFMLQKNRFPDVLDHLRANLSITERGKNSSILQLTMQDENPEIARKILERIGGVYLLQNTNRNAAEAENSLNFIQGQLPEAETNMRAAESAVNAYQLLQQSVDLSFETRSLLEKSVAIEAQLNELEMQERELQRRYTRVHPVYQTLLQNREQLTNRLADLRSQSANLPETQLEMLRLTQNLEVTREIYLQLVGRTQELSVIKAGTIGNIRIIDSPMSFPGAIKPNKMMVVLLSTFLGFFIALGFVLVRSFINRGVESAEELENLALPVYSAVQKVGSGDYGGAENRRKQRKILAKVEPTNLSIEALRSLRTSLHFGMLDAKSSILLITSSRPGEGKSFISTNLATVMAQSGQNICLVDADIRRGYLRNYFGLEKSAPGLTDVLAGEATLEDIIHTDPYSGLHFLPTGKYPPNPSELLMHENFGTLCQELDARFDMTLIDSPPLLAVTDPVIIGKYAGMILLVVRHMFTNIKEVEAALKKLESNGLKANGAVLNAFVQKKSTSGHYSYQYDYKTRD